MPPSDEDRMWLEVRDGSPRAFEALFDRHADFVYNFAFRRTGNWDAAEEIVSAVFLEAWRQRETVVTQDGSIRPWLAGVCLNLVRRHWRRSERFQRTAVRLIAADGYQPDPADEVSERLDSEQQMARILDALDYLPTDQREVLELRAWEELSYEEIAVALGIPVGTVRSRLHRARESLRRNERTGQIDRESTSDRPDSPIRTAVEMPSRREGASE